MRILGVVVALLLVAAVVCAAEAAVATKVVGTVKAVDVEKNTLTVTTEKGDVTVTTTKETKVTEGDAAKTLADVKVGAKVAVTVGEKNVATAVSITK